VCTCDKSVTESKYKLAEILVEVPTFLFTKPPYTLMSQGLCLEIDYTFFKESLKHGIRLLATNIE